MVSGTQLDPSLSSSLLAAIERSARLAHGEEDFKMGVEQALAPLRAELGIVPRYETSYPGSISVLGGGSSDAVYGNVILEYKRPGRLASSQGLNEAVEELERYLLAEAGRYGTMWEPALRRMIGIGLDGRQIFFLRYRGDRRTPVLETPLTVQQMSLFQMEDDAPAGFQRVGPVAVSAETVDLLVLYLRALRRRALTPEALALEFGPAGDVARKLVPALYRRVAGAAVESPAKISTFFAEWDRIFGIVYGQDLAKAERDAGELGAMYGLSGPLSLKPLLFAVHTYYALLMKLLAAELASLQAGAFVSSPVAGLAAFSSRQVLTRLQELEDGGLFARLGIHNFLEGDFFSWYLSAWGDDLEAPIRAMARGLTEYEPATGTILPEATRDLLKKLYQYLVPKQLRHDLGEYYTPDWLAELTLDESRYTGDPAKRFLDPACGSGTFLVLAIRRARLWAEDHLWDPEQTARHILANIVGFDLNPLAVIAARTNYLLAMGALIRRISPVEIPVYLCDAVLTPGVRPTDTGQTTALFDDFEIPSTVGPFLVPREAVERQQLGPLATLLEECVRSSYTSTEFEERLLREFTSLSSASRQSLRQLFDKVAVLEREGRDGLWIRLVKNAFAPIFAGRFDFVVGNPPWIRWGYLSDDYRQATAAMWAAYGLFSLRGMSARLGGGEKDFSMLFTYASADNYLRDGGTLGFLITQEVLKGKGAGEGFRRFQIGSSGAPLKVVKAHDLVQVQPFEGAANKTALLVLRKGEATTYPVEYTVWKRHRGIGTIPTDASLSYAVEHTTRIEQKASPLGTSTASAWQTATGKDSAVFASLAGPSAYKARRGAGTDPYGVFWLKVTGVRPDGALLIENLPEHGKKAIPKIKDVPIESTLLYPGVRGADIVRWGATPGPTVLVAQDPATREPIPASDLKVDYPKTYLYLNQFREVLLARGSNTVRELAQRTEPWAMFGIGDYTFAPYRVAWKRMASDLVVAVLSDWHTSYGVKKLVPTDTTAFVPLEDEDEAHYLASVLNSTPIRAFVRSFSSPGRGFGAPTILDKIAVPRFEPDLPLHIELARLSLRAHNMRSSGSPDIERGMNQVQQQLDELIAQLFEIDPKNLRHMLAPSVAPGPLNLEVDEVSNDER